MMRPPACDIVIVGASLAGARAAGTLRTLGWTGSITVVGDEPHMPYERPPLSKQILAGKYGRDKAFVDTDDATGVAWKLGSRAESLDLDGRRVLLSSGESLQFDGLVLATGAQPRPLPGTGHLSGVFTLRTLEDAERLRTAVLAARHVVVVGGGFIGAEVAATCAGLGVDVTIVDPLPHVMARALGDTFGPFFGELHRSHGVTLHLGVGVVGLEEQNGKVSSVTLGDGSALDADVVVLGIGVVPATAWLEDSGVALDNGIVCDATCTVLDSSGAPLEGVVAAGDVARWHHDLFGIDLRVEHWENAVTMGEAAARTLLADPGKAPHYVDVPMFWSDQHGRKIQFVGTYSPDDEVVVADGSTEDGKFVAVYGRGGVLAGALGVGRAARIIGFREMIALRTPFADVLSSVRGAG